jgi:Sin3 family co-repressor
MDPKAQKKDTEENDEKLEKGSSINSSVNKKNQYEEHLFQCEDERYEV